MATLNIMLFSILGLNIQGDLGPYTCYTTKRRDRVVFLKAPPHTLPSHYQAHLRNKFRRIAVDWAKLSDADKATWELATKLAKTSCTGYDLFTYAQFPNRDKVVDTVFRQAGLTRP